MIGSIPAKFKHLCQCEVDFVVPAAMLFRDDMLDLIREVRFVHLMRPAIFSTILGQMHSPE